MKTGEEEKTYLQQSRLDGNCSNFHMSSILERKRKCRNESNLMGSCVTEINGIVLSSGFVLSHVV